MPCLHTESLIPSEEFDAALAEIESLEANSPDAVSPETVSERQDESPEPERDDEPAAALPAPPVQIGKPPEADGRAPGAADTEPSSEADAPPSPAADVEPATSAEAVADESAPPDEPVVEPETSAPSEAPSEDADLSAAFAAIEQGGPAPAAPKTAGINVKIKKEKPAPAAPRVKINKKMRLKIGDQQLGGAGAAQGSDEPKPPSPANPGKLVIPATPIGKRIYRAVDAVLRWIDRPFSKLDPAAKSMIGRAALTSIVVSILLTVLVPLMFPHLDAIMFLEEKVAELPEPVPSGDAPQQMPEVVPFTP